MQLAFTQGLLLPVHAHTVSTNTATNGSCIPEVTALLSHAPICAAPKAAARVKGQGRWLHAPALPMYLWKHNVTHCVLLTVLSQTWPGANQLLCGRRSAFWRMQAACWQQALRHHPPLLLLLTCQGLLGSLAGPQCARHW
jgi:hypothetical protein